MVTALYKVAAERHIYALTDADYRAALRLAHASCWVGIIGIVVTICVSVIIVVALLARAGGQ